MFGDNITNSGQPMNTTGETSVHWEPPTDWVTNTANCWVRPCVLNAEERAQATIDKISKANILKEAAEKTRPNKPIIVKKKCGNE